jgi:hypothetical protein
LAGNSCSGIRGHETFRVNGADIFCIMVKKDRFERRDKGEKKHSNSGVPWYFGGHSEFGVSRLWGYRGIQQFLRHGGQYGHALLGEYTVCEI